MTIEHSKPNAFEAVCEIASQERWCWDMGCTTCHHMHFNYSLLEVSDGKHPDIKGWVTRKSKHHALTRLLGPLPRPFHLSVEQQKAFVGNVADASLLKIASLAKFPDWLGYVGLVLRYTEEAEILERRLTKAWVPQLQELCMPDSGIVEHLQSILEDERRVLRAQDLAEVERAVDQRRLPTSVADDGW